MVQLKKTEIKLPSLKDSFSRVALGQNVYYLRLSYNDSQSFWVLGLYDLQKNPLVAGMKLLPFFPLNLFCQRENLPKGVLGVIGEEESLLENSFGEEKATLVYFEEEV